MNGCIYSDYYKENEEEATMEFGLPEDEDGRDALVAYLRGDEELTPIEIAERTGLSKRTVDRSISKAIEKGVLKRFAFLPNEVMKEKYAPYFRDLGMEEEITRRIGTILLRNVIVVPSKRADRDEDKGEAELENRRRLGKAASIMFLERMRYVKSKAEKLKIGVSWGRTLKEMVSALRERKSIEPHLSIWQEGKRAQGENDTSLEFIPLLGDFWVSRETGYEYIYDSHQYSSTTVAADLSECFGVTSSLEMSFPAYIPKEFWEDKQALKNIRDFVNLNPARRRLYDGVSGDAPLIEQLNGIITSVGYIPEAMPESGAPLESKFGTPTLIMLSEQMDEQKLRKLREEGAIGDILGHFITKLPVSDSSMLRKINDLFLGPELDDILRCSNEARNDESRLGLIAVASGSRKAEVLYNAIRQGYVNEIVIDSDLAKELVALCGNQKPSSA